MPRQFNILVGAIPLRDGDVLLLQRSETEKFMPGAWGLPCGKIGFGEDLEAAVSRELREESGLTGDVRALCGYSKFMSRKGDVDLHNLQVNFIVDVDPGAVLLDKSNQAFRWVPLSEYKNAGLDQFTMDTIAQAEGA